MTKLPKLSRTALKELRRHKSLRNWKYSVGGRLKSGQHSPPPITLRLPPEKR